MITIQGFAKLCGCNTQTLRYYDRIGLLKPAKVDGWTGYRYYEEEQALQFVKIKNLQQADFSIEEIRPLLNAGDDRVAEAFEQKIREQKQKLERIREIQKSYLKETMEMQKMVYAITDFVEGRMDDPRLWKEFGLDGAEETEVVARAHEMLADWLAQCRNASEEIAKSMGPDAIDTVKTVVDHLTGSNPDKEKGLLVSVSGEESNPEPEVPGDAQIVFERSGWAHISEWIREIPDLGDGKHNYFLFRVCGDSPVADPAFPTVMLAVAAARFDAMNGGMYCNVVRSNDGQNHFTLYRK